VVDVDIVAKLAIITTPILFGAIIWFYKRETDRTDKSIDKFGTKMSSIETNLADRISTLQKFVFQNQKESQENAIKLRTAMLELKESVNTQVSSMVGQSTDIHRQIDKMFHRLDENANKLEITKGRIIQIEDHNKSFKEALVATQKAVRSQQIEMDLLKKKILK